MGSSENPAHHQIASAFLSCRDALVRSILKMCIRQEDVDDILQESCLRLMDASEKRSIASPQGYLFVVSRNLVIEKLSRSSREISMEINDALMGSVDLPADQALYYQRKFEVLGRALQSLPERQRRAILLRKYFGLSHTEIARKMKVSVSSVEKYIASGIRECKRLLSAQGYEFESQPASRRDNLRQRAGSSAGLE